MRLVIHGSKKELEKIIKELEDRTDRDYDYVEGAGGFGKPDTYGLTLKNTKREDIKKHKNLKKLGES